MNLDRYTPEHNPVTLAYRRQAMKEAKRRMFREGTDRAIYEFKLARMNAEFTAHMIELRKGKKP